MTDAKIWWVVEDGQSVGPMAQDEILQGFRTGRFNRETLVFKQGMKNWTPAAELSEFREPSPAEAVRAAAAPATAAGKSVIMHEIDYEIFGEEMQFVEVELDPGEAAVAEAGAMMYMHDGIEMETVFGDGRPTGGFMDKLLGAGKRLLTGESLFMTVFMNQSGAKRRVAFAAPYPGKIIPVNLHEMGGALICQKDAFLCAARGVTVSIAFQRKIGVGLFGGEGFIMQRVEGDGMAFLHAGGTIVKRELQAGQTLRVDTGCLVALEPSVNYDIQFVGKVKSAIFGGEGFFFASLGGPGKVWLQSLPFSRLAGRIHEAAPQTGGGGKGEGSILGGLGGIGGMFDPS